MHASFTRLLHFFEKILQRISQRLNVDLSYIVRGGFWLTLTQGVGMLTGFAMSIGYANFITPETYGNFRYVLSLYTLFAILILPGIESSMIQSIGSGYDSSFERGIKAKLRFGVIGTLAAFGTAAYHLYQGSTMIALAIAVIGLGVPFLEAGLGTTYLNAKKQFRAWSLLDGVCQIASTLIMLASLWLTNNLIGLIVAYCVVNIANRWACIYFVKKRFLSSPHPENDPGLLTYARSLSFLQIAMRLAASIDNLVLFHVLGPTQLAIFNIAQAIPGRLQSLCRILGTLAFPKFLGRPLHDISRSLPGKMIQLGLILLVISLIYSAGAPLLFKTLFPKYLASVTYSQVLIFSNLASVTYVSSTFLTAHKKVKETYLLTFSGLAIKVLSLLIFVPRYGVWGAVISVLAACVNSLVISFGILLWHQRKERLTPSPENGS